MIAGPQLHVIVAGRSDNLRSMYGHWTKTVARSKTGVLLRPNIDLDGVGIAQVALADAAARSS